MKCLQCSAEFEPKTPRQKFCKTRCGEKYRKLHGTVKESIEITPATSDNEQAKINREIDDKYAVKCGPSRRIKGKEFKELKDHYMRLEIQRQGASI